MEGGLAALLLSWRKAKHSHLPWLVLASKARNAYKSKFRRCCCSVSWVPRCSFHHDGRALFWSREFPVETEAQGGAGAIPVGPLLCTPIREPLVCNHTGQPGHAIAKFNTGFDPGELIHNHHGTSLIKLCSRVQGESQGHGCLGVSHRTHQDLTVMLDEQGLVKRPTPKITLGCWLDSKPLSSFGQRPVLGFRRLPHQTGIGK